MIVLKDATISIHSAARAETQAPWGNQAHGEFQSTPPRGRRRIGGTSHTKRVDFNPLRREGGDVSPPTLCNNDAEFQSTPPRGRRPSSPRQLENFWTFQSTPPRGRRPLAACFSAGPICDFNPLRREGGDRVRGWTLMAPARFQSTPPRGRRQAVEGDLSSTQ